jgi:hypothetical protein
MSEFACVPIERCTRIQVPGLQQFIPHANSAHSSIASSSLHIRCSHSPELTEQAARVLTRSICHCQPTQHERASSPPLPRPHPRLPPSGPRQWTGARCRVAAVRLSSLAGAQVAGLSCPLRCWCGCSAAWSKSCALAPRRWRPRLSHAPAAAARGAPPGATAAAAPDTAASGVTLQQRLEHQKWRASRLLSCCAGPVEMEGGRVSLLCTRSRCTSSNSNARMHASRLHRPEARTHTSGPIDVHAHAEACRNQQSVCYWMGVPASVAGERVPDNVAWTYKL